MANKRKSGKSKKANKANAGRGADIMKGSQSDEHTIRKSKRSKRRIITGLLAVACLAGASAFAANMYKRSWAAERDLSVLGNGTPSIVQIHDSSCRLCRQLKKNTEEALSKVNGSLQYRIADIDTPAGKKLQRRHNVPHVTLLLFDGKGKLRKSVNGVQPVELLQRQFTLLAERRI